MATQWHPIFAKLLRSMVEDYYDVQTNVPVGDVPRAADIVLLRRTSRGIPPFQGLWRLLATWNVLEFKGPTVSARIGDLDLLFELGLGIHRRLNEEQAKQQQQPVARLEVSFWYVANHLGRRFLRAAETLLGPLEPEEAGVWRVRLFQRSLFLVSARALPVERDSVPLHLVAREPGETRLEIARIIVDNDDLWELYGSWLAYMNPDIEKELVRMARSRDRIFLDAARPWLEAVGPRKIVEEIGLKRVIEEVGRKRIVDEVGVDGFLSELSPKQLQELKRRLQKT